MARKPIRATQLSPCGNMALTAKSSPFRRNEIWWTLHIKSPTTDCWVEVQGGVNASWMTQLGFDPSAEA